MWIIRAFIKSCSIDPRNKQSPTCEMVHETKESSLQKSPTDFLPNSVGRAWDWWMRLMIQKWVQTPLMKFILFCVTSDLSENLTEMCQISLSWKPRIVYLFDFFYLILNAHSSMTPGWKRINRNVSFLILSNCPTGWPQDLYTNWQFKNINRVTVADPRSGQGAQEIFVIFPTEHCKVSQVHEVR